MAMKLLTRAELGEVLAPIDQTDAVTVPTPEWSFQISEDQIVAEISGGDRYPVTTNAMEQALVKVPGLQKAAVQQWPLEMFLETVNWFYEHGSGDSRGIVHDGKVIGFTKNTEIPIYPVGQVIDEMEKSLKKGGASMKDIGFANVRAELDRVTVGLVIPGKTSEPKPGDIVRGGVWLYHSPTAKKAVEISPYVNRLVCTNGMVSTRSLIKWSWKGGDDFMGWVSEATTQSWNLLEPEFEGLHALTEQKLNGHASAVVADLFERHRVPTSLRDDVLEALIDEADGTMYGVSQAFNRAANHIDDINQMRGLLMVTGEMAATEDRCESCFRYM